jgi:peptidoglycan/LPS O-acetylase OafA/YrhL
MAADVSSPRRLGRRPVLDGMRGIAILLVMLMHTGLLANGYIGVDVFFGLSGFLITTLLYEEWERTGGISFLRFYERRARRLLPALFLLVGAFALVYVLFDPFTGWPLFHRVATTLLFANNWVAGLGHDHQLGALAPTWSLAQEEQFYLLWPLALWVMLRCRLRPLAVLGFLALAIVALVQSVPHIEHAVPSYSSYYSPLDRSAELLLGCACAILWRNRLVPRALAWRPTGWLLAGAFAFLMFNHTLPTRYLYLGSASVAALLVLSLLSGSDDGLIGRIISCRPLRYLGTISYGLYLCNLLVHNLVIHYLPNQPLYVYAPIVIVSSLLISALSWHLVESRVIKRRTSLQLPTGLAAFRRPPPEPVRS